MNIYLIQILEVFAIGFAGAILTAPLSIKIAHRFDIIDRPRSDRRIHDRPIPRFGGMSIMIGTTLAMLIPSSLNPELRVAVLGGILMYILGACDDLIDLKPIVKFAGQWAIASIVYFMGVRISFIGHLFELDNSGANLVLNGGLAYLITVLWIVGVTNAVNLMDGMDGLAAGATMIMSMSLAYVAYIHGSRLGSMSVCVALMAVAGACAGFLPFNFSPARTFMGDGGSLYLGYMIAVLSVISPLKRATMVGAIIPILALAVPLFDTVFAIVRRLYRGQSIMTADKEHLHHHLLAAGFGQRRSVLVIYGIVGIMGIVAVLISRELYKDAFFLALIAILYLGIIIIPKQPVKDKKEKTEDTEQDDERFTID